MTAAPCIGILSPEIDSRLVLLVDGIIDELLSICEMSDAIVKLHPLSIYVGLFVMCCIVCLLVNSVKANLLNTLSDNCFWIEVIIAIASSNVNEDWIIGGTDSMIAIFAFLGPGGLFQDDGAFSGNLKKQSSAL